MTIHQDGDRGAEMTYQHNDNTVQSEEEEDMQEDVADVNKPV